MCISIYRNLFLIYIGKTLFFFVFCLELSIQLFSYIYICFHHTSSFPIYNKHSFFLSQTLPRLIPSAHFSYIQTTLFSLVFAQYFSYIMYYSYIQNKHLFFSLFQARFPRYYVFLMYNKDSINCVFSSIVDSSFLFLFSRIFKILSIYRLCQDIWCFPIQYFFLIYLVQEIWYLYIGYFPLYRYIEIFFLLYLTQIECFSYIYRISPFL